MDGDPEVAPLDGADPLGPPALGPLELLEVAHGSCNGSAQALEALTRKGLQNWSQIVTLLVP